MTPVSTRPTFCTQLVSMELFALKSTAIPPKDAWGMVQANVIVPNGIEPDAYGRFPSRSSSERDLSAFRGRVVAGVRPLMDMEGMRFAHMLRNNMPFFHENGFADSLTFAKAINVASMLDILSEHVVEEIERSAEMASLGDVFSKARSIYSTYLDGFREVRELGFELVRDGEGRWSAVDRREDVESTRKASGAWLANGIYFVLGFGPLAYLMKLAFTSTAPGGLAAGSALGVMAIIAAMMWWQDILD